MLPDVAAEHQASLWTTCDIDIGDDRLTVGVGGGYVVGREGTLPNSYALSDYAVAEAALTYRSRPWRLQVNAFNLFDTSYVDSASPTGTRTVLLGEPLTVRGNVAYRF